MTTIDLGRSSNLNSAEYDPDTLRLVVRFKSGGSWAYSDVPPTVADGLAEADSPGQYFHRNIKSEFSGTPVR